MARLVTSGFELNDVGTVLTQPDGRFNAGTTAAAVATAPVRSGGFAAKLDSTAGNTNSYVDWAVVLAASTNYFIRAYMCFSNITSSGTTLITFGAPATSGVSIRMNSSGQLRLVQNEGAVQIGSVSDALIADGSTWHRIELQMNLDGSVHTSSATGIVNGFTFASAASVGTLVPANTQRVGWVTAPGASVVVYVDDVAINDSTGAAQNATPGEGRIVLLKPTADSAVGTGWVLGNNSAEGGVGWDSVNNEPPVGIADLGGAGADTGQIRNATAAANSNFDTTMTTYRAAGIVEMSTISLIDPITSTAAPVTTSSKQGTVGVSANPVIANIALGALGTSGAFWEGHAGATYPTGWKWSHGTATYSPTVTLGTAPVMRVTQVTSSTRIAMVCFMGMYVEYVSGPFPPPHEQVVLQAMNRAGNF